MDNIDSGTQFDFTYAPGTSMEQIIGFEMAGQIWSSYLNDDVTVRIHVESTNELPDDVVGAALPGKKEEAKYDKVGESLSRDRSSDNDELAFNNLPLNDEKFKKFTVTVDGQPLDKTEKFRLTNANAKSLGFLNGDRDKLDGYILVNDLTGSSGVSWGYDALRSDSIAGNEIDFLSMAMHEVGHILGFTSGIDDGGWLEVLTEAREEGEELEDKDFEFASPLDLYRYSGSSEGIDLSIGNDPYFSIDGGNTNLGNFANGEYTDLGGDGYQASHWQQDSNQGIMNPILPVGNRRNISDVDLVAMDVIGWDLDTSGVSDWSQMYDTAVANAETATVEDRSEDVEKLIKESDYDDGYDGRRRSRNSSYNPYAFQIGYWQYSTIGQVDTPEVIPQDNSSTQTANSDSVLSESNSEESTSPSNTENSDITGVSDESDSESSDSVFLESESEESSDTDDDELDLTDEGNITGVSDDELDEDSLFYTT